MPYPGVAARLLKVLKVEPIVAVTDTELGHVFRAVRSALDLDSGYVLHVTQIDYQMLVKVGRFRCPRRTRCVYVVRWKGVAVLQTIGSGGGEEDAVIYEQKERKI